MDYKGQALVVLGVFAAGLLYGAVVGVDYALVRPVVEKVLVFMVLLVGVLVGVELEKLAGLLARIHQPIILAASTLAGALVSGVLLAPLLGVPLGVSLAITVGSGWYSFTGSYLATISPYYGFIGFTANMLREILTLVSYPILSRRLVLEAISMGGATTMDSTLPVIARFGGSEPALVAFIHGLILTIVIPVLVPLLASIP